MIADPNSLEGKIQAGIREFLKDPTMYPDEFKSWLPRWAEVNPPATQLTDIQGLYTMNDTVASLGAKINGRVGMIRSGSSPYEYLRVTYDSVAGKWLSDAQLASQANDPLTTTSATFVLVPTTTQASTNLTVVNAIDLYNAGLRPQISWSITMLSSAVATVAARPAIFEFNTGTEANGGTLLAYTTGLSSSLGVGGSSASVQAWEDVTFDATPSKSHWYFGFQLKTSAGTGSLDAPDSSFRLRWVG